MKYIFALIIVISVCVLLSSCSRSKDLSSIKNSPSGTFTQISQEQAKKIMDTETGYVILDVRTIEEYENGHIPGAILLPYDQIPQKAESILTDKNQKILVYCRSGNRSKIGSASLVDLGYSDVLEFGGINTWPYEIER